MRLRPQYFNKIRKNHIHEYCLLCYPAILAPNMILSKNSLSQNSSDDKDIFDKILQNLQFNNQIQ